MIWCNWCIIVKEDGLFMNWKYDSVRFIAHTGPTPTVLIFEDQLELKKTDYYRDTQRARNLLLIHDFLWKVYFAAVRCSRDWYL